MYFSLAFDPENRLVLSFLISFQAGQNVVYAEKMKHHQCWFSKGHKNLILLYKTVLYESSPAKSCITDLHYWHWLCRNQITNHYHCYISETFNHAMMLDEKLGDHQSYDSIQSGGWDGLRLILRQSIKYLWRHFSPKDKCEPYDGRRGKVKGWPKQEGFMDKKALVSVQILLAMHPIVVIFQSGSKCSVDRRKFSHSWHG